MIYGFVVVFLNILSVSADYDCLCNYAIEDAVYVEMSKSGATLGYMYEFDCKQLLLFDDVKNGWNAIAFEHKIGYVCGGPDIQIQTCAGDPLTDDLVPTTAKTIVTTPVHTPHTKTTSSYPIITTAKQTSATTTTPTTIPTTSKPTTTIITPKPITTTITSTPTTITTSPTPTTTTTTSKPTTTTTTTTLKPITTTNPPIPTTTTTTPKPTTTTTTPKPTTTTTTPKPTTTTTTPKPTTTTTMPKPTTTTTTQKPTTTTTTPNPTATTTMRKSTTPASTTPTLTTRTTGIPVTTHIPTTVHGNLYQCPHHFNHDMPIPGGVVLVQHDTSCYEFVPTPVSWSHAEQNCKLNGGHLVTINSASEQNFIYNFLVMHFNHTMWIGLHDQQFEEYFQWTSGERVTYTHWVPNRKSYNHNVEDCVYMVPNGIVQGMWNDIPCGGNNQIMEHFGVKNRYICEYHAHVAQTVPTTHPTPQHGGTHFITDGLTFLCQSSIKAHAQQNGGVLGHYKNHCYELLPNNRYSWQHGEQYCRSQGGHLAHIANADEQNFLQQFLHRHLPDDAIWIGLSDVSSEGRYLWTSGDPIQYTNWVNHHAGNYVNAGIEDCVVFLTYENGAWDDIECGIHDQHNGDYGEAHPIVCEYGTAISGSGVSIIG